ncbi:MAG: FAD-dependent oxidoreductase [Pseudomonadaceae bacterium]|nr:FAD-dependent oxidoreductase [Pseudomonadaceae bacterium]
MPTTAIIGAGHAAGQLAASLRQEGYEGDIVIYGDELHIPYQRPPLSKAYLAGELGLEKVYLRPAKFYEDKNITLRIGETVTAIDPATKTITSDEGSTLQYDDLVLATGGRPRKLPIEGADLGGIHYLRSISDVDGIRAELAPGRNLVIVGGGYIGLEVASIGIKTGATVHVLEMESRILQRVTTPQMSEFYDQLHSGRGVQVHTDTRASAFMGDGKVSHVVTADGTELDADLVVVGIGIIPNSELAEAAGLECDNGIVVDDHCRTEDPHIYAIGDVSNHPNPLLNRRLRLESVPNAMEQARVVASNIVGKDKVYAAIPWFWSDQYELKLQMVGFSSDGEEQITRGNPADNQFITFYMKDGKVVAADAINDPKSFMAAKNLVGKAIDAAALADPAVELKSLMTR